MRRPLLIAGLCLMAASASAQEGVPAPGAVDMRLYARLMQVTDNRAWEPAVVDSALASSWRELRAAAALAVGQLRAPRGAPGAPLLRSLLADGDVKVAANAAYALGLLADSLSVAALAGSLQGPPEVAREAAWSLGEIGAPAREAVIGALGGHPADDATTIQLLLAAAKMRPVPVAAIRPFLSMTGEPNVVWAAAYAIARFRAPDGVRDLLALAENPEIAGREDGAVQKSGHSPSRLPAGDAYALGNEGRERTRAAIARGLTRQAAGDSLGDSAVRALSSLLRDPRPHVRVNAVTSLATYGAREHQALAAMTHDPDPNVRIATAQVLGTVLDSLWDWHQLWIRDSAVAYKSAILASAMRAGVRSPPPLARWLADGDWRLRAAALNALAATSDTPAIRETAGRMVRDSAAQVRSIAYGMLARTDTAGQDPVIRELLAAGLTDADQHVRAAAASGLGRDAAATEPAGSHVGRDESWYRGIFSAFVLPSLQGRKRIATIETEKGSVELELFGSDAPITVWNFARLAGTGYYRGTRFHRVVPNFVAQDGDPRGDGNGGPGYSIRDEINPRRYERGVLGMALAGPDTGGSQYFITHSPQPHLDGHYTIFGRVVGGWDVLDSIVQGDAILSVTIR